MNITFRKLWLVSIFLVFSGCCELTGECPDPLAVETPVRYGTAGCYAASYNQGAGYGQQLSPTLGDAYADQAMREEVMIQQYFYNGIPANVVYLNEGNPEYRNAYATPDGYILFGVYMFHYTYQNYNGLAVSGVLAHEWGHRTQFVFGWPTQNPGMELEADAFSGYYMALAKQWAWSQIQGYFQNVYAIGDYYFNSPQHHGTPNQRLAAAYLGVNVAVAAIQNRRPFSYQELHQIFSEQIRNVIIPARGMTDAAQAASERPVHPDVSQVTPEELRQIASGQARGSEVEYPRRLTRTELGTLRPYNENLPQH